MKRKKIGRTVTSYMRSRMKVIFIFVVFICIFAMVFSLYSLNVDAVEYAALLCAALGTVFVLIDFYGYWRKHTTLLELAHRITLSIDDLPQPADMLEEDYHALLDELYQHKNQLAFDADAKRSEMVDYFTLWAHQIKTPIAAMRLLLQNEQAEERRELSMELFKIEQYVEMVLQYLRLDGMSSDLLLKSYSLADIVRQAIRKYARVFILKKIKLEFEEPICDVLTDEKWLAFVIEQLLSNALKYTRQGGTVSVYMKPDAEKTLVIRDTGIGIQEEDLPRICEKGFTGYNGRMDKKSTGIGLYLCKQILTKLSHTLTVSSKLGEGTTVELDLSSAHVEIE